MSHLLQQSGIFHWGAFQFLFQEKTVKMDIFEHKHKAEGHTHLQIHLALGY